MKTIKGTAMLNDVITIYQTLALNDYDKTGKEFMSSCELKLLAMICYITRSKPNICFAKQKQCHAVAI